MVRRREGKNKAGSPVGRFFRGVGAIWPKVGSSVQGRIVSLATCVVAFCAIVMGISSYQLARDSLYARLDGELLDAAQQTVPQIRDEVNSAQGLSADSLELQNVTVQLVGANKSETPLIGARLVIGPAEISVARLQTGNSRRDVSSENGSLYRAVAVPFTDSIQGQAYALVVGRELTPTNQALRSLAVRVFGVACGLVLFCVLVTYVIAHTALAPIRRLTRQIAARSDSADLRPVQIAGQSEVAVLGRSFNAMLTSLGRSQERQQRLIADASHELRTPLTSLRTNIELLIADDKTNMLPMGARREILRDVAAQLGEFTSLVGDLMALSREETRAADLHPLDLQDVVTRAVTRARRRGPGITFAVSLQPTWILGDEATLERAFTNLLDNAVKFSPPGGTIQVVLADDELTIDDEGHGIAERDLPHIFDRFYRSDTARNTPGTGLGLSIVEHTVSAHGGTIAAGRSPAGGARFVVRIPGADPADLEGDAP